MQLVNLSGVGEMTGDDDFDSTVVVLGLLVRENMWSNVHMSKFRTATEKSDDARVIWS